MALVRGWMEKTLSIFGTRFEHIITQGVYIIKMAQIMLLLALQVE